MLLTGNWEIVILFYIFVEQGIRYYTEWIIEIYRIDIFHTMVLGEK